MNRWKFNGLKSQHFACVYKLVFPNGKIYVGKSKDIGKRMSVYERKTDGKWSDSGSTAVMGAMRLYGCESVEIEVLFKVSVAYGVDSEKDLDYALGIVEMRWIKELGSNNPDVGYNSTDGGEMFGVRNMERVKEVERQRIVYKDVVVERERERQTNGVPVVGYDINGNYIGEWPSRIAFTKEVVGLKQTMDYGEWKRGYIMYEKTADVAERVESYSEFIERTKAAEMEAKRILDEKVGKMREYRETKLNDGVVLVGKNGEEVARYDCLRDAAEMSSVSYSSLYACLKKGFGTAGGFRVFYSEEWDAGHEDCLKRSMEKKVSKENVSTVTGKRHKLSKYGTVYQYDRHFNEVGRYVTMQEASAKTGIVVSSIYAALKKGGDSFAGGYHWRFESDRVVKDDVAEVNKDSKGTAQTQKTLFEGFSSEDL